MDISLYFEPVDTSITGLPETMGAHQLARNIEGHFEKTGFPSLENTDIALFGVKEERNAVNNAGCANGPDVIRKKLYRLFPSTSNVKITDLGNIRQGHTVEDTYFAVSQVAEELIKNKVVPIIIGGSQDLTYANYKAYENLKEIINIVSVDSSFDLGETEQALNAQSYLSKIILHQPNYLFNYTNLGYQTYYVDQEAIRLMRNLYFDIMRLGDVRADMKEVEPVVRNADMLSFDISAIRMSDAPGNANAGPNGFYGEECCQIMRYAGMSDKLSSIGFYEYNPLFDRQEQTAHLIAQAIWYFIEGYSYRTHDFPHKEKGNFIKFMVTIENHDDNLIFFKSKKSERWWMEVSCPEKLKSKYERHYVVPCSYADYETALTNEVPNRWWQVFQKLM